MTKSLLSRVYRTLESRPDIRILVDGPDLIAGVQLRRIWEKQTLQPGHGMMRHEREGWAYVGQAFVIEEPLMVRKKPDRDQQVRLADLAAVGTLCILPRDVADVVNALGTVPEEFGEWLERKTK